LHSDFTCGRIQQLAKATISIWCEEIVFLLGSKASLGHEFGLVIASIPCCISVLFDRVWICEVLVDAECINLTLVCKTSCKEELVAIIIDWVGIDKASGDARCYVDGQRFLEVFLSIVHVLVHEGCECDDVIGRVLQKEMLNHLIQVGVEQLDLCPVREEEVILHQADVLDLIGNVELPHRIDIQEGVEIRQGATEVLVRRRVVEGVICLVGALGIHDVGGELGRVRELIVQICYRVEACDTNKVDIHAISDA